MNDNIVGYAAEIGKSYATMALEHGADVGSVEIPVGDLELVLMHALSLLSPKQLAEVNRLARQEVFNVEDTSDMSRYKVQFQNNAGFINVVCADRATVVAWLVYHDLWKFVKVVRPAALVLDIDIAYATLVSSKVDDEVGEACPVCGWMIGRTKDDIDNFRNNLQKLAEQHE